MDETNPTPWGAMMGASNDAGGNEPDGEPAEPSGDATSADIEGPSPVLQQQITPDMVAAGYQPGMATQNITIGDEGNGPKVPMIIAAVLVVIGLVGFGIGIAVGASIEDTFNKLSTVDYTTSIGDSGELTHDDEDGMGEEGWYLLIPGDPKADENNNGIIDACEDVTFSVLDETGDDASERTARISCSTDREASDTNLYEQYFDIEDHIIVARICYTIEDEVGDTEHDCEEGEVLTVSNDAGINMSVVDLDAMYIESGFVEELLTKSGISVVSFGAGCCSACGGLIALIIGLTRLGGKKPAKQYQFQIQ
ncbi:MAG: hypothetical protein VX831_03755 [Candidatus Thermoplasmatota archaeon]|nr:hypothetical protein [Candidatus Thermoplasmatota archaeon]